MDWIESFHFLNQQIHSFCYNVSINSVEKNFKLKIKFPEIFPEGLGRSSKVKATFKIKGNVSPILRPKRKVPFAAEATINKELDHLEEIGMYPKWTIVSEQVIPFTWKRKIIKLEPTQIFLQD